MNTRSSANNFKVYHSIPENILKTFDLSLLKKRRDLLYSLTLSREKQTREMLYIELGIIEILIQKYENIF